MSEKGIIKLVTNLALIIGITIVCVALISKGEIESTVIIILIIGLGYIVLQWIKKLFG